MRECNRKPQPIVIYRDGLYVAKVWFISDPDEGVDWFAAARHDDEGKWIFTYRFRYYADDRTHDSKDEKRFYVVECENEGDAIDAGNKAADMISQGHGLQVEHVLIKSDKSDFIQSLMARQPWVHTKPVEGKPNV
jgi:hypothetical protein